MELNMGIYDAPEEQKQPPFKVYPLKANIAVFGGPMTGKTTFIKTLLVRLHEGRGQEQEEIYIVDFGGSLGGFGKLQNICAYFDNSSEENIKRVFRTLEKRLSDNADRLQGRSFYEVYHEEPANCPPHLTFIIENINAFLADERYEAYRDQLEKLCRDGLSKGLTVVVTGRDTTGVGRLLTNFAQKIGFGLNADEYMDVFGSKIIPPMRLPGRGIANVQSQNYEFQCFLPFPMAEKKGLEPMLKAAEKTPNPRFMKAFERVLSVEDLARVADEQPNQVAIGLDYYEHKPVFLDYGNDKAIGIYGKRQFGKTNLLKLILDGIRQQHSDYRFVYLDDGRNQLRQVMKYSFSNTPEERDRILNDIKQNGYFRVEDEFYLREPDKLAEFLVNHGYVGNRSTESTGPRRTGETTTVSTENKPAMLEQKTTVFVIDNKMFYQAPGDISSKGCRLFARYLPELIGRAEDTGNIVIFAEIRNMNDVNRDDFDRLLSVAFLLDNLGEFIMDRGNKTVFRDMDAKEMKMTYARCEVGDGYIYNIEADKLQKLKFAKTVS